MTGIGTPARLGRVPTWMRVAVRHLLDLALPPRCLSCGTAVADAGTLCATCWPDVEFIAKGVGVRSLTPEGYDAAWNGILPAAEYLAKQGVEAIMVIGGMVWTPILMNV